MFEKLFVVFTNADTFSVVKLHEIRARLDLMQEKPAIISVSEVKPKNLKFERQLSEYIIEGHVLINGDLNYLGIDWENTSTSQGPGEMENEFLESVRDCFLYQHVQDSTCGRGMETIVREEMVKHMKVNGLYRDQQYGFISGRSIDNSSDENEELALKDGYTNLLLERHL
ncbi:hypothetical protein DPMN_042788 [Dreissena polymorpha]|uniref:Uncharacterized protein n=1 Tax=Dreissena polymorpha TaxID=45954 RepID=A0A9D4HV16_DREPO|nr:hypothetical protein DPMN_042788 [Dreissena polymorpha]